jgi:hypothetical protein
MSTRHGRDTAVLSLSRPYHRKQHSLIRGATPPPASDPFGSQPRQQPSARKASSTSARRSRPSSRWKCCSQPKMRSTTQEAPTSEPCSVWRRCDLRCVVGSRLDPAYRETDAIARSAMPVELAAATVSDLPQAACRKPTRLRARGSPKLGEPQVGDLGRMPCRTDW